MSKKLKEQIDYGDYPERMDPGTERSLGDPEKSLYYNRVLNILDSKDKIPYVTKIGNFYYNFWQDANNKKGLLRRITLESYKSASPAWDIVLDIDKLAETENENWV